MEADEQQRAQDAVDRRAEAITTIAAMLEQMLPGDTLHVFRHPLTATHEWAIEHTRPVHDQPAGS